MLKFIAIAVAVILVLLLVFILWRLTSVGRGMRQRDEKLLVRLDPIGKKIETGQAVSPQEIEILAARPEIRFMLFAMLREMKRPELLPTQYSSSVAQGESALAYWMMHPNELQDAPESIELVETVKRPVDGQEADFHVYRYKMPAGHWAAKDGWLLGLAGPMRRGVGPYSEMLGAFSRAGDIDGKVKPSELVDWYVDMLRQKGMIKTRCCSEPPTALRFTFVSYLNINMRSTPVAQRSLSWVVRLRSMIKRRPNIPLAAALVFGVMLIAGCDRASNSTDTKTQWIDPSKLEPGSIRHGQLDRGSDVESPASSKGF
jgi:hypothetical protein